MADNVLIDQGADVSIAADDVSGVKFQKVKIDGGGDGVSVPLVIDATFGVPVDIKRFPAAAVLVNNPTAANLKVDASGVAVPVTDNGDSLTVDAPVGTPVFVRLSDGTNPIATLPVNGSVTAAQGAAAALASAWGVKLTNGTDSVGVTDVGGAKSLNVSVKEAVVNLTELGGDTIAKVGTGIQVVAIKDSLGAAISAANPLPVTMAGQGRTRVTKSVSIAASQTGATVWTPTSGKKFYITKIILVVSVAGTLTLFDATNAAANLVFDGTIPTGVQNISFEEPWASATADNVLKYTSGTGMTAVITLHGFEV